VPHSSIPAPSPGCRKSACDTPILPIHERQCQQLLREPSPSGVNAGVALPPTIPRTDFQAGYFSIFMAGNFGSDIAFWVDDDLSVSVPMQMALWATGTALRQHRAFPQVAH